MVFLPHVWYLPVQAKGLKEGICIKQLNCEKLGMGHKPPVFLGTTNTFK